MTQVGRLNKPPPSNVCKCFVQSLVGFFWVSPWVEAEYTETFYTNTLSTQSPLVVNQVRAFETGNQVILIKEDGTSIVQKMWTGL